MQWGLYQGVATSAQFPHAQRALEPGRRTAVELRAMQEEL